MGINTAGCVLLFLYCLFVPSFSIKSNDVRNYLGTRTPYRYRLNKDDSKIKFEGCQDTKIWMIIRHGTRLPSAKDIIGMNSTLVDLKYEILLGHRNGRGSLTKEQLKHLESWSSDINPDHEKFLTREGQDEMVQLAERMQKRFPNTIKSKYDNQTFLFRYTATERAQQSARYFTIGLFDKKESQDVLFHPASRVDPVLRFYKHCDKWQKQVKKNPSTYEEQVAFGNTNEMRNTLEVISNRLGLDKVLSLAQVNLMYKICGIESSWNKFEISPWCYAFDSDSAEMFEYYHDLKHYWMDGYGHDLTYRQACLAIKHMFENFRNASSPNAIFLFAHSGTLLKVIAHMQLYKPASPLRGTSLVRERPWKTSLIDCFSSNLAFVLFNPLRGTTLVRERPWKTSLIDCFSSNLAFVLFNPLRGTTLVRERPWKTSLIDCFSSNLAFVLFKCEEDYKILTLHQERIIKLPMCETELCPMDHLLNYFKESIFNCDYNDMCSLNKNQ